MTSVRFALAVVAEVAAVAGGWKVSVGTFW